MADSKEDLFDPEWPPGTIRLTQLLRYSNNANIILQPRPTSDPNDPLVWSKWQKGINYALASIYAMMVYAFINISAPTWGPMGDELGFSYEVLINAYGIGGATLAVGAPMLIPFALKYGSRPVYIFSSIGQFAISIWAARTMTVADWYSVNALQCWLGTLAEVLIQITIADTYFVHQRGAMNTGYIWFMNIGQSLSIVAAGYITDNMGWRWVWWWFTIFLGIQVILFVFGFEETKFMHHKETLDERQGHIVPTHDNKLETIAKVPGEKTSPANSMAIESDELTTIKIDPNIPRKPYWKRLSLLATTPGRWSQFLRHSWQPVMMFFTIPGVAFSSLVYAIVVGTQSTEIAILSTVMIDEPYSFSAAQIGLMNLAPFIGASIGALICGPLSDWIVIRLARRNDGIYEPEMRFWVMVPFIPFQLAGAWWFGYALNNDWSWPQVAIAWGLNNVGTAPLQSLCLTYMIDAYNDVIGDALTAVAIVRTIFATIFVFVIPAWTARVGIGNIFNTICAIGTFIFSFAFVFIWKGKYFRVKTVRFYKYYADRQFDARAM